MCLVVLEWVYDDEDEDGDSKPITACGGHTTDPRQKTRRAERNRMLHRGKKQKEEKEKLR